MSANTPADAVVVGAGIFGASVAHHLLQQGARRVVVLDAGDAASGTSGAGGGFVGLWAAGYASFFDATDLEIEQYGIDFYQQLAREHPDIDCLSNGNLYLATTEEGFDQWVAPVITHPLAPAGTRALSPDDVAEVTRGVIPAESVTGGALHPGGIQISAGRTTRALIRSAQAAGADVRTNTRVLGLLTSGTKITGVRTETGDITARHVVLACGAWTNELLADVDYTLPMLRMIASRAISPPSKVSPDLPTVMVPDLFGLWVREHRGGLTWGNGDGYAPLHEIGGTVGHGGQPRREELVTRLDEVLSPKLRKLIPAHDTSIGWWVQGVPCMTPDRRFYAGSVPDRDGLHVLAGDNEAGVTHGPGVGRLVAEIITSGSSAWVDPSPYRLDRFAGQSFSSERDVAAAMPVRR